MKRKQLKTLLWNTQLTQFICHEETKFDAIVMKFYDKRNGRDMLNEQNIEKKNSKANKMWRLFEQMC